VHDDDEGGVKSGNGGYVVKFKGVEIDLESWKEHIFLWREIINELFREKN
jgi:hypothetical protein